MHACLGAALMATVLVAAPVASQTTSTASPAATNAMTTAHIARYVNDARLAGEGKLTWLGFHVYDARLYAPAGFDVGNPFAQQFVLELTYARKLEGKAIAEASRDEMQRLAFGTAEQQARWLAQMEKLFPDVEKGRRIAGVNQPGKGARFYVDGNFVGSVDEPDFARAFFAIWLDPRTRAPRLRESLLKAGSATAAIAP
jgi:hypothetical protein